MQWDSDLQKATFSAGRFWGVQFYFDQVPGVIKSRVGYTGGKTESPSEEMVASGTTGHTEAVEIEYDPSLVNYDTLLKHFFRIHDPTKTHGEGKDIGDQFRSVIYHHTDDQKVLADIIINQLKSQYKKPIQTQILPATIFYKAEAYHQKYTQTTGKGMHHVPYEPV